MKKIISAMKILSLVVVFLLFSNSSFCADTSNISFHGSIQGNLACTADCGNCCTGIIASDTSKNLNMSIGGSDIELNTFYDDKLIHAINGYYYSTSGSCGMGTCSLFYVTSVDENNNSTYNSQSGKVVIPSVSVSGISYRATLNPPYVVENLSKIVGKGQDCSKGEQCDTGYTCSSYSGISGMEFKSCEIACSKSRPCPGEMICINIADGHQNVCQ